MRECWGRWVAAIEGKKGRRRRAAILLERLVGRGGKRVAFGAWRVLAKEQKRTKVSLSRVLSKFAGVGLRVSFAGWRRVRTEQSKLRRILGSKLGLLMGRCVGAAFWAWKAGLGSGLVEAKRERGEGDECTLLAAADTRKADSSSDKERTAREEEMSRLAASYEERVALGYAEFEREREEKDEREKERRHRRAERVLAHMIRLIHGGIASPFMAWRSLVVAKRRFKR